ncbi:MAG: VWA domain-containing protein [Muribaculaceae bacterium]|nr:VWA domain-containing protein [Muribaculaceae bacterium]
MFDFANPHLLYLLATCVAVAVLFALARASRRRKLRRFGRQEVIASLMPEASRYKAAIKIVLEIIALAAIVIVLARPRAGQKEQEARVDGIEVMIAFDVSNSMLASASDDPAGISRLDRSRLVLEKLIDRLHNDKVGLVIFAGDAKTQLPLTTDFYSAKMYLNELHPGMMANQGTDISGAINMAMNGFSPDENTQKAIILITDSEDHEGEAIDAVRLARENGIQVNIVGVGSAKGAPIPMPGHKGEYMRDMQGNVVTTSINEELGRQLAEAGGGIYVNAASGSALEDLDERLNTLEKSEFNRVSYSAGAEQFPTFAWIALIMLVIDLLVLERKIGWLDQINFFTKKEKK